ncbi:AMP-binding protein [Bradyrhizobium tropiciagri]|uniref:class I adenylate-forming enzyme family protein n=1 Tax=Bradyrhizobium tropiciagri TaxID=312253 RepID=UPI001BA9E729|nr:AMP-binding protein [Bradyrhizobium tropiciagri]MBR0874930.1 AMP-binding protein [Bradyrhizobium tropiciagri]
MILERLSHWASVTPQRPFVVTAERSYSFAEIHSLSLRCATLLRARGIGKGDHVALISGNSAAFLITWFGVNAAGAVAVCLNDQLKGDSIDYLVTQSDSRLIMADRDWLESRRGDLRAAAAELPFILIDDEAFLRELAGFPEGETAAIAPHDVCTILYTSGTTGRPKGVMCAHGGYAATGVQSARILELTADDRIFVYLPLYHTNPQTYAVMSALTVGASLGLRRRFSATSFFEDAKALQATGCTFVGTVLAILAARYAEPMRDHAMRFTIGGGTTAELARTVEERFGVKVHELYGMTEVGGWVSGSTAGDHKLGANGRVRPDMQVRIVDPDDNPLPVGERGEIVVRPLQPNRILLGYYNKPDELAKASRNFWFHTGDVGSFDSDGYLYFHGRTKELIRRGGEMISPQELEGRLLKLPGVRDCAIVGVADPIMGEEVKAVVVTDDDFDLRDVRGGLADQVPNYMLPRFVERVPAIPRTQTEKILRRELQYIDDRVTDLTNK